MHNQRLKEERKKRKQPKHLEAVQEVNVGSDGGSNSSGMNEVKEVVLDRGTNENNISEDAASVNLEIPELQDSPLSSGYKIGKDLPGVEGDIPYPQRFASKGMKNVSLPIGANAGSNTVDLSCEAALKTREPIILWVAFLPLAISRISVHEQVRRCSDTFDAFTRTSRTQEGPIHSGANVYTYWCWEGASKK